ncbi:MAG: hypothetical protein RM368_07840 [Nostoc sp. DedSLP03]|uniref:hypothetical protein n=1 Tax=Nostoc sp. DedSLP03 TaxID=3075400 RepID=UPI002AD3B6D5|nr:hypothetical protein [Nostoc sp. DedSLP03]MDZ7964875.1 hypothetical protein [Nostoc sp. DedSLP03]
MANLEILVSELPTLIQSLKLTIGDSNQIMEQIIPINNAQEKLRNIKKLIVQELRLENVKNSAIATLPRIGTVGVLFIPSGGLIDPAIAEKFGNSETKISLTDLQSKIDDWLEWGYFLQAIAADILSDIQLVNQLNYDIINLSISNQLQTLNESLKIDLALAKFNILKHQIEKISDSQKQLLKLQQKLNYIFDTIKNSRNLLNILLGVSAFYGKSGFALEWLDDDHELIISSEGKFQELTDILNDCDYFQEQIAALIIRGNTLTQQGEQALKKIEEESSREAISSQKVGILTKFSTPKIIRSALIIASSLLVLTFTGLKIKEQNLSLTQETSTFVTDDDSAIANFKSAQKLGMEAASLVQKPPHPLKVWQEAETKWYHAIILLDNIPAKTSVYDRAKNKLAYYQINYKSISKRVLIERKAVGNLELAHKLATEANLFKNSPHSQLSRQQAQNKWRQAINLLEAIPESTSVFVQAKEMLSIYKTNYAGTNQQS